MTRRQLAFDVGGANIKLATNDGFTESRAFPLWKHPDRLADELKSMVADAPTCDSVVATMTGELADCYSSKRDGVRSIVEALRECGKGRPLSIYMTDGTFVGPDQACEQFMLAAASNWHALASYAARLTTEDAVLVDIGTTTCDIIPISEGQVVAVGRTDTERLLSQELIYAGIERTPVCAVSSTLPYRDMECPVARELFATTLDVHLVTGDIPGRPDDTATADGRPATREYAIARLARCICADASEFGDEDATELADFVSFELSELVLDAINAVSRRSGFDADTSIILSGHGDFLLRRVLNDQQQTTSLSDAIGPEAARCAPAYAVAKLAAEHSS